MWVYGEEQVWWIVQPFSFSCLSCFSQVTLLVHFAQSWAALSHCLHSEVAPLKFGLCNLGPFPLARGWDTAQLALPTQGFSAASRKVWTGSLPQPICFPSLHQGCVEVCEAPQGLASSSSVSEEQRFCTKTCWAGALPHQLLWGHTEGAGDSHGAQHCCEAARCSGEGQGSAAATAAGNTEQPLWECHALPGPGSPTTNQDPAAFNELHQSGIMVRLRQLWMGMMKWKLSLTKGNSCCRLQALTLN